MHPKSKSPAIIDELDSISEELNENAGQEQESSRNRDVHPRSPIENSTFTLQKH